MTTQTTLERVKKIVEEQLGTDASSLTEASNFIEDLGTDSLDRVELVMAVEEEFDIEIDDEDAEKVATIGDAVQLIDRLISEAR